MKVQFLIEVLREEDGNADVVIDGKPIVAMLRDRGKIDIQTVYESWKGWTFYNAPTGDGEGQDE